jgi:hypothetical protein
MTRQRHTRVGGKTFPRDEIFMTISAVTKVQARPRRKKDAKAGYFAEGLQGDVDFCGMSGG